MALEQQLRKHPPISNHPSHLKNRQISLRFRQVAGNVAMYCIIISFSVVAIVAGLVWFLRR